MLEEDEAEEMLEEEGGNEDEESVVLRPRPPRDSGVNSSSPPPMKANCGGSLGATVALNKNNTDEPSSFCEGCIMLIVGAVRNGGCPTNKHTQEGIRLGGGR